MKVESSKATDLVTSVAVDIPNVVVCRTSKSPHKEFRQREGRLPPSQSPLCQRPTFWKGELKDTAVLPHSGLYFGGTITIQSWTERRKAPS